MPARGQAREALLEAACTLFAERGYDRTTTRDVAELAGVDAALIARYYGGKDGLYLAALQQETAQGPVADLLDTARIAEIVDRVDNRGGGPVLRAILSAHEDPQVQQAASAALHERLVVPLTARYREQGVSEPELRAQISAAAFAGVVLARRTGTFAQLADADPDLLVALVHDLLRLT